MERYWYRICPTCEQGRLFVKKMAEDGSLYLLCEECFCVFSEPGSAADGGNCQDGIDVQGTVASYDEIVEKG